MGLWGGSAESGLEPGLLATRQGTDLMTFRVTGLPLTLLTGQQIQQLDQEWETMAHNLFF